ncbi:MAG: hypothetical protein J6J83_07790 [Oscillospiraceae bacterium]|nr:hypothetical protein [Oscillospiraceae bacterium]
MRKSITIDSCLLLASLLLYLLNQLVLKRADGSLSWLFRSHFNDLLAPIALLSLWNIILVHKKAHRIESNKQLFQVGICCSVCWEWLAIYIKPTSTFDVLDICAYFTGIAIYKGVVFLLTTKNK